MGRGRIPWHSLLLKKGKKGRQFAHQDPKRKKSFLLEPLRAVDVDTSHQTLLESLVLLRWHLFLVGVEIRNTGVSRRSFSDAHETQKMVQYFFSSFFF